jgi:hypothetical protein
VLRELAPGVSAREVQEKTGPSLLVYRTTSRDRSWRGLTMNWPEKTSRPPTRSEKRTIGAGVFRKCDGCAETIDRG